MTTPGPRVANISRVKILSTSTIQQNRVALLFWGESDTGKTFDALTFPNPFVVYFDTNMSTLRKFPDVPFMTPTTWLEVERDIIPAIRNRRLSEIVGRKVETVIFDSLTFCNSQRMAELSSRGKMEMSNVQWSELYAGLNSLCWAGANATKPLSDKPDAETYHFICTVHKTTRMGKKGEIIKVAPTVDGQMRDQLHSFFDAVLVFDSQSVARSLPQEGNRPPRTVYEKERFAWTVDPDQYTKSKNHIGPVPAKLIPTYQNLAAVWGLDGANKAEPTLEPAESGVEPATLNTTTGVPIE